MPSRRNRNRRRKPGPIKDAARAVAREAGKIVKPILSIPRGVATAFAPAFTKQAVKSLVGAAIPAITAGVASAIGGRKALPAAYIHTQTTRAPRQTSSRSGNMVVAHSEYIGDIGVRSDNQFDLQYQFGLNPGNTALFPWLSQIASRFDAYRFRRLSFRYETTCSTNTPGIIMMAIDTDASDAPPTQSQQMLAYKNAVESVVYAPCSMHSARADLSRLKTNYVLTGLPPPNTDIKTYDVGNFYLAVVAPTSPNTLGRLHVDYEVELMTPQIVQDPPSAGIWDDFITTAGTYGTDLLANVPTNGNLPVYFVPVPGSNPPAYECYVTLSGTYQLSIWVACAGPCDYSWNITRTQPNDALFNVYSGSPDVLQQLFQIVQFQNPQADQPAFTIYLCASEGTNPSSPGTFVMTILPISSSITLKQPIVGSYPVVVPDVSDPRNRFGRRPTGNTF